jgi:hypothetical protein
MGMERRMWGENFTTKDLVLSALEDPNYRWRTLGGIARSTGLPEEEVRRILLDRELDDVLLEAHVTDLEGNDLFTTRDHYERTTSLSTKLLCAITGKIR